MATHLAAVATSKSRPFETLQRATLAPGPGELLVAVRSVALNPADMYMRDLGLLISTYPTVAGFDFSGLVLEIGEGVPVGSFQPGVSRVAGYASSFWRSFDSRYGAFQERCIVPWQHVISLPANLSWNHAATLPVAVQVPLMAWDTLQLPRVGGSSSSKSLESREKGEAILIWGASSSVGTMGVQTARLLKQDENSCIVAVYATCGSANKDYVRSLGADIVFDYKDPGVVNALVSVANEANLVIRRCFLAMGQLAQCQSVLKAFTHDGQGGNGHGGLDGARIASAPIIPQDAKNIDGVEVVFLQPPSDEDERLERFRFAFGPWLTESLARGIIKPSPEPKVVGKGLESINQSIDMLREGVSCTKLVVEVSE
ncbi:GroES-like protein [Pyrenochaeta sp. DS3sAY3a]|nr:GroES-like protein [Pyrenochaeta sp. DS3sAY3a]